METYSLYNGDVMLKFDPIKHVYWANGKKVDNSISGALKVIDKPALIPWALKMAGEYLQERLVPGKSLDEIQILDVIKNMKMAHRRKTDTAADIGTLGHKWVEDYLTAKASGFPTPELPVNEELRNIAATFLEFMANHKIEVIHAEKRLYSKKYDVAGTADGIVMFEGEMAILDWKTGSGIYPEYLMQMGGYDVCYTEELGLSARSRPIKKHVLVNCSKTGILQSHVSNETERNRKGFLAFFEGGNHLTSIKKELKESLS